MDSVMRTRHLKSAPDDLLLARVRTTNPRQAHHRSSTTLSSHQLQNLHSELHPPLQARPKAGASTAASVLSSSQPPLFTACPSIRQSHGSRTCLHTMGQPC